MGEEEGQGGKGARGVEGEEDDVLEVEDVRVMGGAQNVEARRSEDVRGLSWEAVAGDAGVSADADCGLAPSFEVPRQQRPLLHRMRYMATTDVQCMVLKRVDFDLVVARYPAILAHCLEETDQLRRNRAHTDSDDEVDNKKRAEVAACALMIRLPSFMHPSLLLPQLQN